MPKLFLLEIKDIYQLYKESLSVSTDTRQNLKNTIFFALKGDNFNGNKFAKQALNQGANYVIIDELKYKVNNKTILVDDVLKTLQKLANFHRKQLNIPIIALTGSNGKTTTKELINVVLNKKYNCSATKGNLNNHIGVPLTLLTMGSDTEIGVVEMGANHPNEIDFLCEIALPDFGFITNFGKVHLEGFKSLKGVIKAKTEMYSFLKKNDKTVFVNANDSVQLEKSKGISRVTFGTKNSDYPIDFISANPYVNLKFDDIIVKSKLIGSYNYANIAAAIAIGKYYNIKNEEIKNAIEQYVPSNNRSQIIQKESTQIILDAYNANPNSMKAALENLEQLSAENKIAILGDMFEIGKDSLLEHKQIVELAEKAGLNKLILIGKSFYQIETSSPNTQHYQDYKSFENDFDRSLVKDATILIKASRGMALERILELI